jgi:hypothetical protein
MYSSDVGSNNTTYNDDNGIVSSYDDINRDDDNDVDNDLIDADHRVTGIDDEVMNELSNDRYDDDGTQEATIPQQLFKKFKSDVKKPKTKWVIYSSEVGCSY